MAETVITGWHPAGFEAYGAAMVETFDALWPRSVRLTAYVETYPLPLPDRCEWRPLWSCDGVEAFINANKDDPVVNGKGKPGTTRGRWRYSGDGYGFAFDAVRFCRQCFIPEHAVKSLRDGDVMAWIDADVVTVAEVPDKFIEGQLDGADVACLWRGTQNTELGFWAMQVNPRTRQFVTDMAAMFRSGRVFELPEWHSGYVFDHCLMASMDRGLKRRVLTGKPNRGHVWFGTELGRYMDHLKGAKRKILGYSPERYGRGIRDEWRKREAGLEVARRDL